LAPYALEINTEQEERALDEYLSFLAENHSKSYIHLVLRVDGGFKALLEENEFQVATKPNFVLDLRREIDELRKGLSNTRRRHINKAEREIQAHFDRDRDQAFALFRSTYDKGGLSVPEEFFDKLEQKKTNHRQILVCVYEGDQLLAANLCVLSGTVAYYLLGGVNSHIKNSHAGSYSMWNCILKARELGAETFDFCGSSVQGIARFFKSFGAGERSYLEVKRGHKAIDFVKRIKTGLNK
jgi:lipid II:glycine glycyltransferase (peptidoglycan interpeptide bridge formation enzyme)